MAQGLEWVSSEHKTPEFRVMCRWFGQVMALRDRFSASLPAGFDPLRSNEAASVGLLAAAASRSGLLTLTDYVSYKRGQSPGTGYRRGRCDLWVGVPARHLSWAFEFKQWFHGAGIRRATIEAQLGRACQDACQLDALEADRRFGGLIITAGETRLVTAESEARLAEVGARASYCCRMAGRAAPVWLFLQAV